MDFAAARRKWERLESQSHPLDASNPRPTSLRNIPTAEIVEPTAAHPRSASARAPSHASRISNPSRPSPSSNLSPPLPPGLANHPPTQLSRSNLQAGWQDVVGNTAPSSRSNFRQDEDEDEDEVVVVRGDQIDENLEAIEEGYPSPSHSDSQSLRGESEDDHVHDEEGHADGESYVDAANHAVRQMGDTSARPIHAQSVLTSRQDRHSEGSTQRPHRLDNLSNRRHSQTRSTSRPDIGQGEYERNPEYAEEDDGDYHSAEGDVNEEYNDDDNDADEDENDDHDDNAPVRQNSNFSRLSAQSWLTVDSLHDPDPQAKASPHSATGTSGASSAQDARQNGGAHAPPAAVSVDPHATVVDARHTIDLEGVAIDVQQYIRGKSSAQKTVLECCIDMITGTAAYKKKAFRRFGARRVWLSFDCKRLCWTSRKGGLESPFILLSNVSRLRCHDREVSVEVLQGRRVGLLFGDAGEACMWTRCLSCLIPLQATVRAPPSVVPSEKDREDYNLVDDLFHGRALRTFATVNAYVILGSVPGHNGMARLVLSRADKAFLNIRYVPQRLGPFLLRSNEEIAVLKRLTHPNIVKYHDSLTDPVRGGHYVVFEHTPRGVVTDTVLLEGVAPISERSARLIICDLISGLQYLHALRIVHADIRPDNILRAVDGSVKLNPIGCITQDFTEIRDMTALVRARLGAASSAFLAPELCWYGPAPNIPPKSYAMDVWAVGAVLYFLLYGRVPFYGNTLQSMQVQICTGKLKFPRKPETSRKVRNFLKGVLGEKDPKNRISLSDLMLHPWFSDGGSSDMLSGRISPHVRLVVTPEEVGSAVSPAKVRKAQPT